jgi:predicted permease
MLPWTWRRVFRLRIDARDLARDVDQELDFHLQMRTQRLMSRGLDFPAAQLRAQQQFGDLPLIRDECLTIDHDQEHAVRVAEYLSGFRQDLAYAFRTLGRQRRFATTTLLVLAIGLGANIAMYALIDALMHRTLPVPHPEQLISVGDPTQTGSVSQGNADITIASYPLYRDVRDQVRSEVDLLASGIAGSLDVIVDSAGTTATSEPQHPRGRLVSNNYFAVLGVTAMVGRTFMRDSAEVAGADAAVVISESYWRRAFASNPSVVGRSIRINGSPFTIVGVAARGFTGEIVGQSNDIWIPLAMQEVVMPRRHWLGTRQVSWLMMMGRLTPGTTLAAARPRIVAAERHSIADHDSTGRGPESALLHGNTIQVQSGGVGFSYYRRPRYVDTLFVLTAAVALMLVVVCANVANLLLARGMARSREIGIRIALGAARARVVRQLLAESFLLAVLGSALGLGLAWGMAKLLLQLAGGGSPINISLRLDPHLVGFVAALTVVTTLIFGLLPAVQGTRVRLEDMVRSGGRGITGQSAKGLSAGRVLVAGQVALSLVLLVGMSLLQRSLSRLQHADLGLDRNHLLVAEIDAQRSGYDGPSRSALVRDLMTRVAGISGVSAVSVSRNGLYSYHESRVPVTVTGYIPRNASDSSSYSDDVGPGYVRAIGAHLLAGRDLRASDGQGASRVVLINQSFARQYFRSDAPLGRRVVTGDASREVVGVVADVQDHGVRDGPVPRLYRSMLDDEPPETFVLDIRTSIAPGALIAPVRRALTQANASLKVTSVQSLGTLLDDSISQDRVTTLLLTVFGLVALGLASIGLYGVMSYNTLRRTSEFGLRSALGATRSALMLMVLRETGRLLAAGIGIGLAASLVAVRVLRTQVFQTPLVDPVSIGLAVTVLGVALLLATSLPARRAARISPLVALRSD